MFEEFIKQTMIDTAARATTKFNQDAEAQYLGAARDWAINKAKGANPPPPLIPTVIIFEVTDENGMIAVPTVTPVSNIKPESFLPTFGTDANAVGGPVGGPIPEQNSLFYAASGANPQAGDVFMFNGATFVYQRPTPFGGYWRKLS